MYRRVASRMSLTLGVEYVLLVAHRTFAQKFFCGSLPPFVKANSPLFCCISHFRLKPSPRGSLHYLGKGEPLQEEAFNEEATIVT